MVIILPNLCGRVGGVLSVLGGRIYVDRLPTFGDYHEVDTHDDEGERLLEGLHDTMTRAKYASNKGTYLSWLTYFTKGAGQNTKV